MWSQAWPFAFLRTCELEAVRALPEREPPIRLLIAAISAPHPSPMKGLLQSSESDT
jgi:hypothetical protein